MAGLRPASSVRETLYPSYINQLRWAALEAAKQSVDVLIEPINTRDIPGFFLNRQDDAHQVVEDVGVSNLKVQMDLYHCQIVEGDLTVKLRRDLPTGNVCHVQIAGVPGRHEPDVVELNYPYLFAVLDEFGYEGWVGCEYRPRSRSAAGRYFSRAGLAQALPVTRVFQKAIRYRTTKGDTK